MKTQNPWKIAFLTLSGMILIFIAALAAYLFSISTGTEDDDFQRPQTEEVEGARFTVSASRDDINYWLERELAESGEGEDYELYLEDLVYFHTEVEALGFNVPVEMELEPVVTDGGNVELISRSFSIAGLGLPSSTVLSLIQGGDDLPDWIHVLPEEGKFYLDLRHGISEEVQIEVHSLNLPEDDIEIQIVIP
ncbi:YpmS family protein [Evansella sp. LMS18]|uniref:YpmS family protein n=1 Tax=Evansella sp. LMS18 TaxID=2924033 RepID=UPI0020D146ED|nr:YpmS family protein [Evansella sp. LMS18]UTR09229.1 YpmS family protein [Evansella sp. LMS18]